MLRLLGSGFTGNESQVNLPMMTGDPLVIVLNRARSRGMYQGILLLAPMIPLFVSNATITIFI